MNINKEDKSKSFNYRKKKEIFSKTLISRSRRYFFDTNETNAGDYFLSITESKKLFLNDGRSIFKKHKIFLYKEDFNDFKKILSEMIKFIYDKKGKEVIINKIQDYNKIKIEKDSKEKDSKEKDSKEKDSKEKDSKEKDSKEKDRKEKNSKEKDRKEKRNR